MKKIALFLGLLVGCTSALAAYNPTNPNGQATMANSQPVVVASNQSAIPVSGTFWQATQPVSGTFWQATQPVSGTFWQATQPVSIASMPTTAVTGPLTDTQLRASAVPVSLASVPTHAVTQSGAWTVTGAGGTFPVTGTFWQATQPVSIASMPSTPVTGTFWQATQPVSGPLTDTQLRASAVPVSLASVPSHAVTLASTTITGSVAVTGTFWQATQPVSAAALPLPTGAATETTLAAVSAKLPTAAAVADGATNPTTTAIGSESMLFNGTTWDRERNNVNANLGDTGVKTTTFGGAAQTNYNARGAVIFIQASTVSGTSPTMTLQLQWSPDGGTNWLTYGPVSAALTASGHYAVIVIYPANLSATPGATPTAFVIPATVQMNVNAPLPRTWRLAYTIAGTTPSFTISAASVNYIN